jgi:alanine dehydrogenase
MTLLLDAADVDDVCAIRELIVAIEGGLAEEAEGGLSMPPRLGIELRDGGMRVMPVALNRSGLFGFKVFHWTPSGARFLIAVYEQARGELLALIDGDYLTSARTGATAGVAAKYLARKNATRVAVLGSGVEARTNLAAMCEVREINEAFVFSPREHRREAFASWSRETLGVDTTAMDRPEECVRGCDIVVVATNTGNAQDPIAFHGAWAAAGIHISSIGSTLPRLRELDAETFARADRIIVDAPAQMREESGDVIAAIAEGTFGDPLPLHSVIGNRNNRRTDDLQITLFKSVGTAMQDIVAGFAVYQAAVKAGRGREIDLLHVKPVI